MRPKQTNMKKILLSFSTLLLASMLLVSCSKNSPKDVANTWLTSFYHMDYEAAKKVSTDDTKALLTQLSALSSMMPDSTKKELKNISVTIKDVKEDGDKATVTYSLSGGKDAPKDTPPLKLVKQGGKWLVQFTKQDQMGGDGGSGGGASSPDQGGASPAGGGTDAGAGAPPADTTHH